MVQRLDEAEELTMRSSCKNTILTRLTSGVVPLAGLFAVLLLGGCAGPSGLAAYRQGDYAGALREFQAEGDPAGDFAVGVMAYKGEGVARDPYAAADWFRRAAGQGHAAAQYNLGLLYLRGEGAGKDRREAARWFQLAAEQGNAKGQIFLGGMYARGEGMAKDRREAARWFRMAAVAGNAEAQVYLGVMYS